MWASWHTDSPAWLQQLDIQQSWSLQADGASISKTGGRHENPQVLVRSSIGRKEKRGMFLIFETRIVRYFVTFTGGLIYKIRG